MFNFAVLCFIIFIINQGGFFCVWCYCRETLPANLSLKLVNIDRIIIISAMTRKNITVQQHELYLYKVLQINMKVWILVYEIS